MKRATPVPFVLLVVLALAALFVKLPAPKVPTGDPINSGDVAWMLTASALVLLMTPGLSFFYGGMVGFKNVVSTMLQSVVALGVISLLWVAGRVQPGVRRRASATSIGDPRTFFMFDGVGEATHPKLAATIPLMVFALFQLKFAIITPALITGSFAERVRFSSYLLFMVLFSLLIYCPLAHWTWHPDGFLQQVGREGLRRRDGGPHVGRAGRRWPGRWSWAGARATWPRRRTSRRTSRSCCWGRGCSGSAGSGSTPARRWRPTARRRWRSRRPTRRRPRRCSAGCSSTGCGATSPRRSGPASARWSAWWRSPRRPGFVTVRESIVIGLVASVVSNLAVALEDASRRSTTRSTSSPATASAGWSACSPRASSPRTSA